MVLPCRIWGAGCLHALLSGPRSCCRHRRCILSVCYRGCLQTPLSFIRPHGFRSPRFSFAFEILFNHQYVGMLQAAATRG